MKTCTKCGLSQSFARFYKRANGVLRADCKACHVAAVKSRKARGTDQEKEARIQYFRLRYQANKPLLKAQVAEYAKAHREYVKARFARYQARKMSAPGACSTEQLKARFEFYGNRCAYCGGSDCVSADHVIPLFRGGSNFPANIRPACRPCNSSKGTKKLSEWRPLKVA